MSLLHNDENSFDIFLDAIREMNKYGDEQHTQDHSHGTHLDAQVSYLHAIWFIRNEQMTIDRFLRRTAIFSFM